jgi:hypothetical protein
MQMRNSYEICVETAEGGQEDNTKTNLKDMFEDMDWIQLAQNWAQWRALVNTVMNLRVP